MSNAILIHGMPSKEEYFSEENPSESNSHWFPWLQKQLLIKGVLTQTPEMPAPYEPNYDTWCNEFEQFHVSNQTILVGHSCGAGFLVRWLSENKIKVKKLVLVAPWLDPQRKDTTTFFDFTIDPTITNRTDVHILVSTDDYESIQLSVNLLKERLPYAKLHTFSNMGHFTYGAMHKHEFPELLDIILSQ